MEGTIFRPLRCCRRAPWPRSCRWAERTCLTPYNGPFWGGQWNDLSSNGCVPSQVVTHGIIEIPFMTIGGGQPNSSLATLRVNDMHTGNLAGPFASSIVRGSTMTLDLYGAPNVFFEVYASQVMNPSGWNFGGFGVFDLGTGPTFGDCQILLPGFQTYFPLFALNASGQAHLSFYVHPSLTPGPLQSIQALIQNPQPWVPDPVTGVPVWGTLTAAQTLVVQ